MHAKSAVAVALLAAAPMVSAVGSATITNKCHFPIYMWTVSNYQGQMQTIDSGESHSEPYKVNPNGGGVSMKIASNPSTYGAITQYEYTLESTLWYDISNVNGNPFGQWGIALKSSDSSCRNVHCPAGVEHCSQIYNTPTEDWATAACAPDSNTNVILCSDNDLSAGGSESGQALAASGNDSEPKEHHHHHHHHDDNDVPAAPSTPVSTPVAPPVSTPVVPTTAPTSAPAAAPLTTFVTKIVTITARDAEPSHVARHMHQHHVRHNHF